MEDFDPKAIGERIREKRLQKGMTQQSAADKLRMSRETFNTIENGKRALKDFEIVTISNMLDTSCDYILNGTETENIEICKIFPLCNESINVLKNSASIISRIEGEKADQVSDKEYTICLSEVVANFGLDNLLNSQYRRELFVAIYTYFMTDFSRPIITCKDGANSFSQQRPAELTFKNEIWPLKTVIPVEALENGYLKLITDILTKIKREMKNEQKTKQ